MMTRYRGIEITHTELPDTPTQLRWKCEAIRMGFDSRATVLRLCWARWYWRAVRGLGPTRKRH